MSIRPSPATGKGAARTAREAMRPEFLNRIDEIVLFQTLGASELRPSHSEGRAFIVRESQC